MEKTLDNTNVSEAKAQVSDIKVFGNGDLFQLLAKASSEEQGWFECVGIARGGVLQSFLLPKALRLRMQ